MQEVVRSVQPGGGDSREIAHRHLVDELREVGSRGDEAADTKFRQTPVEAKRIRIASVQGQGLGGVVDRCGVVAEELMRPCASGIDVAVVRPQPYRRVQVVERTGLLVQTLEDTRAVQVREVVVGVERQRSIEVGQRRLELAQMLIARTTVGVAVGIVRIQTYRRRVVADQ
jgi:hypothetical protein